jgi:hypothetical protein
MDATPNIEGPNCGGSGWPRAGDPDRPFDSFTEHDSDCGAPGMACVLQAGPAPHWLSGSREVSPKLLILQFGVPHTTLPSLHVDIERLCAWLR